MNEWTLFYEGSGEEEERGMNLFYEWSGEDDRERERE